MVVLLQAVEPTIKVAKAAKEYGSEAVLIAVMVVVLLVIVSAWISSNKRAETRFNKMMDAVLAQLRHGNDDDETPSLQSLSESMDALMKASTDHQAQTSERLDRQEALTETLCKQMETQRTDLDRVQEKLKQIHEQGCLVRADHEHTIEEMIRRRNEGGLDPAPA